MVWNNVLQMYDQERVKSRKAVRTRVRRMPCAGYSGAMDDAVWYAGKYENSEKRRPKIK